MSLVGAKNWPSQMRLDHALEFGRLEQALEGHAGMGLKQVDGRRVSTRKKIQPLRWWCSERKTYCRKHQSANARVCLDVALCMHVGVFHNITRCMQCYMQTSDVQLACNRSTHSECRCVAVILMQCLMQACQRLQL
jgi:hypothetical protein